MSDRLASLHALFCEDVRFERSGFTTYVGVLPQALTVRPFPITIPKLCIIVSLMIAPELDLKGAECIIVANDNPIAGGPLGTEEIPKADPGATLYTAIMLQTAGLTIDALPSEESRQVEIKAVLRIGDKSYYSNALLLVEQQMGEANEDSADS